MRFKLKRSLLVYLFLIGMVVIAYGAMNPFVPIFSNPTTSYKIVSTKYVDVVYEPGCEWAVHQFLEECDDMYSKVTSFYNTQPFSKLTVVFENDTNVVNSLADPVDNVIYIFLNSSQRGFFSQDMRSWMSFVFSHELTHILLTQMGGIPQMRVYGNPISTIYNAAFIPAYLQEGLAQYSETRFNPQSGRLNDPLFEMYLKGLVISKEFKGLGGGATYNSVGWYPIGAPYIIGGSFVRYITNTYGATSLKKAIDVLSHDHISGVANAFEKATNKNFNVLVKDWMKHVKDEVNAQISKVGIPIEGIQLTHSGRWTAFVNSASKEGIFFYYESANDVPKIKEYSFSNASLKDVYSLGGFLYQGGYIRSMAISPDGEKLAFVKLVTENGGFQDNTKCFVLGLKDRTLSLLPIENPLDVSWISENKVVYSEESGGLYSIKEYDIAKRTLKTLVHFSPMVITSISTHNGEVYFSANVNGIEDIYKVDADGNIIRLITGDFLKIDPFVTKDGKYILFSASKPTKNGVFNIYAFDTYTKRFYQVTNVELGAFLPRVVNDKLFYTGYTKNGYNLFALDRWLSTAKEVDSFKVGEDIYQSDLNLTDIYFEVERKSKPYFPTLQTIGSGLIPTVSFSASSSTVWATYTVLGFDLLRTKLGWNNFYAVGSVSTDKTLDFLSVGMSNYGRYNLSASVFLTHEEKIIDAILSYPVTLLFGDKNSLFYPTMEYSLTSKGEENRISDDLNFGGVFVFAPTFVPNNSLSVNALHVKWNVDFSPLKPATPSYNVTLDTSIPMLSSVTKIGAKFENKSINIFQMLGFPNLNINWYDISGVVGLKYIDVVQFSDYDVETSDFKVGVQSDFNFDSFLYSQLKVSIKVSYDVSKERFEYRFGLNF